MKVSGFLFLFVALVLTMSAKTHAQVHKRVSPLGPKPRLLTTSDLGVLERESQKFVAPVSAQENPILDVEAPDEKGNAPIDIDLNQSIDQGIQNATHAMKSSNADKYQGEALLQSYAQFLPTLDTGFTFSEDGGKTLITETGPTLVDSRNYGPSYNITASLNLFNGLADINQLSASHERKSAADLSLVRAKQQVALDVIQSFLQVILDGDLVEIARNNLAASQAQERLMAASTTAGIRNKSDLYQEEAQVASDEAYLASTEDKKRADLLLFLRKIRLDPAKNYHLVRPKFPTDAKADPRYADEKNLVDIALKNRPDLQSFRDTAAATHHEVNIASAPYLPKLDLNFSILGGARHYDSLYVGGVNDLPANQPSLASQLGNQVGWTAALALTWNLFDRGLTRLSTAQAQVTADNADIDSDDTQKQVVGEIRQSLGDYRKSIQQLASSQTGLVAAQKAFDLVRGRYEVGIANYVDLITAQAALLRAEDARSQAIVGFQLQTHAMEVALGTYPVHE